MSDPATAAGGSGRWSELESGDPDLFSRMRELEGREVRVRFAVGLGEGARVEIPALRLVIAGRLRPVPGLDRFGLLPDGWGPTDLAWFARRRGRGGPPYWQGALEYRPAGRPTLVLYFTAPLDGLEIRVRD